MFGDSRFEDRLPQALWTARSELPKREQAILDASTSSSGKRVKTRLSEKQLEDHLCEFYDRGDTSARTQVRYRSPNWQPNPGGVDLEVTWRRRDGSAHCVWAEVKWASMNLSNCAWDVAKMGLAVREGLCDEAYLVAGCLHDSWAGPPVVGREFLGNGEWDTARDVLHAHHTNWLFWKKEVETRPLALPAVITTRERYGSRPITLANGDRWSVIVAKVEAPGTEWIDVDERRVGRVRSH